MSSFPFPYDRLEKRMSAQSSYIDAPHSIDRAPLSVTMYDSRNYLQDQYKQPPRFGNRFRYPHRSPHVTGFAGLPQQYPLFVDLSNKHYIL